MEVEKQEEFKERQPLAQEQKKEDFLLFYCLDLCQIGPEMALFGKVRAQNKWNSCCLRIYDFKRTAYLVPEEESISCPLESDPALTSLKAEARRLFPPGFIQNEQVVDAKYCFDLPLKQGVRKYLRIQYALSFDNASEFRRSNFCILGNLRSSIEDFIIHTQLGSPQWLQIPKSELHRIQSQVQYSSCNFEYSISEKSVHKYNNHEAPRPPMRILTLKFKMSIVSSETSETEEIITAVTGCIFSDVDISDSFDFADTTKIETFHIESASESEQEVCGQLWEKISRSNIDLIFYAEPFAYYRFTSTCTSLSLPKISRILPSYIALGIQSVFNELGPGTLSCNLLSLIEERNAESSLDLIPEFTLETLISQILKVSIPDDTETEPQSNREKMCHYMLAVILQTNLLMFSCDLALINHNPWIRWLNNQSKYERTDLLYSCAFTANGYVAPTKNSTKEIVKGSTKGGEVFESLKGLYRSIILVLDVRSLYPSIIREYRICHSNSNFELTPVLPKIMEELSRKREVVKAQLKNCPDGPLKRQLDDYQKAIKLSANKAYGHLSFPPSRYRNDKLADEITAHGRKILVSSRETVQTKFRKNVIYGDTDSLFIDAESDNLEYVLKLGEEICAELNKNFQVIRFGIDACYSPFLLFSKKKYAGKKLLLSEGVINKITIAKGIETVRKDIPVFTRDIADEILEITLNDEPDTVKQTQINQAVIQKTKEIPETNNVSHFIIRKKLGKNLAEYNNDQSLYHVQVARARKQRYPGSQIGPGTIIPYIMAIRLDSKTQIAIHSEDFCEFFMEGKVVLDYTWYKNQVFTTAERLLEPLPTLSLQSSAQDLGIQYYRKIPKPPTVGLTIIKSFLNRNENVDIVPVVMICPRCRINWTISLRSIEKHKNNTLFLCPDLECTGEFPIEHFFQAVSNKIREILDSKETPYTENIILQLNSLHSALWRTSDELRPFSESQAYALVHMQNYIDEILLKDSSLTFNLSVLK